MQRHLYLLLAIAGTAVPVAFFVIHFGAHGVDLGRFLQAAFVNAVASGLTADLLISSAAFWVYLFTRRDGPSPWPFVAMNLLVGLSLALPLYLWLRSRESAPAAVASTG